MTSKLPWYLARASGLTAWWLLAASTWWGMALATRVLGGRGRPGRLQDLHRFLGGLALVFVGIHLAGLAADRTVSFGPAELFVPFASRWRPGAVAWGIVGLYLLAAVEATSLLMRRLPRRWWRRVHSLSFAVFGATTVHALRSGSDAHNVVFQWSALAGLAGFCFLAVYRALAPARGARAGATP